MSNIMIAFLIAQWIIIITLVLRNDKIVKKVNSLEIRNFDNEATVRLLIKSIGMTNKSLSELTIKHERGNDEKAQH